MPDRRRALIVGGTRGIGRAVAEAFAAAAFDVTVVYRTDNGAARQTVARLRDLGAPAAAAIQADATAEADVRHTVAAMEANGGIDVLVHSVGEFLMRPFLETSTEDWHRILASNLLSAVLCARAVLPGMRRRRRGSIVHIATMHADRARTAPNTLPYAIAKAGVIQLTRTLARTEGEYGIRVNAVSPGFVEGADHPSPTGPERVPLKRWARPEEIASAVAFLSSDRAAYITGAVLDVHGGALL